MTDTHNTSDNENLGRHFSMLFASTSISSLGAAISAVSLNWIVYHFTGSVIDVSYLGLTGFLPGIVLGLFAGVFADRYNRRRIMVISDISRMLIMGFISLFLFFSGFSLVLVLASAVAVNSFSSLFLPASQALVPKIVSIGKLERANGMLQGTQAAMFSVGSAFGGVIVAFAGAVAGLGINSVTYALSAVFLFQIASNLGDVLSIYKSSKNSIIDDLKVGIKFMKEHLPILEVTLGFLPVNFFGALVETYLVVYSAVHFGPDAAFYGYLAASISLGIVVGSLAVGLIHARRFAGWLMGYCIIATGVGTYLLALSNSLSFSITIMLLVGVTIGLINTTFLSTIQAIVPNDILARVMSVDSVGSFSAIPAGIAAGGIIAVRYGINASFMVASIGLLINGVIVLLMKGFRSIRYIG